VPRLTRELQSTNRIPCSHWADGGAVGGGVKCGMKRSIPIRGLGSASYLTNYMAYHSCTQRRTLQLLPSMKTSLMRKGKRRKCKKTKPHIPAPSSLLSRSSPVAHQAPPTLVALSSWPTTYTYKKEAHSQEQARWKRLGQ
jgi:hypothetical protein